MGREPTVAAIDIGTTKICTLVGQTSREWGPQILGVGVARSRGLKKGVVVSIDQAAAAIQESIEKAERSSGSRVTSAVIGISGNHIESLNNRGVVAVARPDRVITPEDVDRAIESARAVNIPSNREIVHVLPRSYSIDGQDGVENPVGMYGFRLDVETHIATAASTAIQNLTRCLQRAEIEVEDLVVESLASGEAVLSQEEKEMGVVLVDIGGGTTDIGLFVDGEVWHSSALALGGHQLTNDLAIGLQAPFATAEEAKVRFGYAIARAIDPEATVEVVSFGAAGPQPVSRRRLGEVIQARLEEILDQVLAAIKRSGYRGLLPAGLVLTGGTASLPGIDALAREVFQLPVRIGRPEGLRGLGEAIQEPAYATSVGLLLWGLRERGAEAPSGRRIEHVGEVYRRFSGWIRELLPQ